MYLVISLKICLIGANSPAEEITFILAWLFGFVLLRYYKRYVRQSSCSKVLTYSDK
jgi:hypothetical protein